MMLFVPLILVAIAVTFNAIFYKSGDPSYKRSKSSDVFSARIILHIFFLLLAYVLFKEEPNFWNKVSGTLLIVMILVDLIFDREKIKK